MSNGVDTTVIAAFAVGFVSFISPCVLPLVPGYLSAVTVVAAADLERADWRRVIVPSLLFVASFSAIFILLGLTATGIGSALQDHQQEYTRMPQDHYTTEALHQRKRPPQVVTLLIDLALRSSARCYWAIVCDYRGAEP